MILCIDNMFYFYQNVTFLKIFSQRCLEEAALLSRYPRPFQGIPKLFKLSFNFSSYHTNFYNISLFFYLSNYFWFKYWQHVLFLAKRHLLKNFFAALPLRGSAALEVSRTFSRYPSTFHHITLMFILSPYFFFLYNYFATYITIFPISFLFYFFLFSIDILNYF